MKSIVVYFSQTGNTLKVAEAIYAGIRSVESRCEIARIKDVSPSVLKGYDLIGLGCPVFFYREPLNVRRFIDGLSGLEGKHVFMFCSHATILGSIFSSMGGALTRRGLTVVGSFHSFAGASLQYLPTPWFTDGHPDAQEVQEAADFGRHMLDVSRRVGAGEKGLVPELVPVPDRPFYVYPDRIPGRTFVDLRLNREKCKYPACRLCMDNCPMNGIDLGVEPPVFRKDCIFCHFCEKICPEGAIEADWGPLAKISEARIKNVYQKAADLETVRGHFRRYVDQVSLDSPYYKVHSSHPRFPLEDQR